MSAGNWNDLDIELHIPAITDEQIIAAIAAAPLYSASTYDDQLPSHRRDQKVARLEEVVAHAFTGDWSELTVEESTDSTIIIYGTGSYVPENTKRWLTLLAQMGATGTVTIFENRNLVHWELFGGRVDSPEAFDEQIA